MNINTQLSLEKEQKTRRALGILCAVLAAVLAAGGVFTVLAMLDPLDGRVAPGVSVGGLELEGMTWFEAGDALTAAAEETLLAKPLEVALPEQTLILMPDAMELKLSVSAAVKAAFRVGRSGEAEEPELGLAPYLEYNDAYLQGMLQDYAARYDTVLTQPVWSLEGTQPELSTQSYDPKAPVQNLLLTIGLPECHLDAGAVTAQILSCYDAAIRNVRSGSFRIAPEVLPSQLPDVPDIAAIYRQCAQGAVNDSLDMNTYQLVHGAYGYDFDVVAAVKLMAAAEYGQTLTIPMACTPPEILGEGAYFRDVLGSCETKHTNDENRNTNLRLVCEFLNGMVIQPGEEFSFNQAVGERTPERGFKPATAYSGSRKTKDYGGGVCQGSTTLYNCLLLADMEILKRSGHGALVTYVPLGLDAAVNWATKTDLIFRNNFNFPVKILAEVSDGYMKMKLMGTDEKDYYIEMEARRWEEGDYYYATSYKNKYDKETGEKISRDFVVRSSYVKKLEG